MENFNFKTTKDIVLEINNKKVAAAKDYDLKTISDNNYIEAFGEDQPIAIVKGKTIYQINFLKMFIFDNDIDIFNLDDFNLKFSLNNKSILYEGCHWNSIKNFNDKNSIFESVSIIATKRIELI